MKHALPAVAFALASMTSHAEELVVLAGGSLTAALKEIAPLFEQASGHKLTIEFASTPQLIKRATSGQPFDLGVVPVEVMKDEAARQRFAAEATRDIARVGYGVAMRAGAARPDIGTVDAFRKTLLDAKSVAFLPESAAGAYVIRTFERLGIAEAMKAKTVAQATTGTIPQAVAKGDAELGIFLTNVLVAPGVELVGPFPAALQQDLVFTGAVAAQTKHEAAARSMLDYLRAPAAAAVLAAKGLTPARGP